MTLAVGLVLMAAHAGRAPAQSECPRLRVEGCDARVETAALGLALRVELDQACDGGARVDVVLRCESDASVVWDVATAERARSGRTFLAGGTPSVRARVLAIVLAEAVLAALHGGTVAATDRPPEPVGSDAATAGGLVSPAPHDERGGGLSRAAPSSYPVARPAALLRFEALPVRTDPGPSWSVATSLRSHMGSHGASMIAFSGGIGAGAFHLEATHAWAATPGARNEGPAVDATMHLTAVEMAVGVLRAGSGAWSWELAVRGMAGLLRARGEPRDARFRGLVRWAPYVAAAIGLQAGLDGSRGGLEADASIGWAQGLEAAVDGRPLLVAHGPFVGARLSARSRRRAAYGPPARKHDPGTLPVEQGRIVRADFPAAGFEQSRDFLANRWLVFDDDGTRPAADVLEYVVTARGHEIAREHTKRFVVAYRLPVGPQKLDVEIGALASRHDAHARHRQDPATSPQVALEDPFQLPPGHENRREAVVERQRFVQGAIGELARRKRVTQSAAVVEGHVGTRPCPQHEVDHEVAERRLFVVVPADRAREPHAERTVSHRTRSLEIRRDGPQHALRGSDRGTLVRLGPAIGERLRPAAAQLAGRMDVGTKHAARGAVEDEIDAPESASVGPRFDDGDAVDAMCNDVVGVPGGNHVDQALRQRARKPEDLGIGPAAREVVRRIAPAARSSRMGEHDHHVRPLAPQRARLLAHRFGERPDGKIRDVGRDRRARGLFGRHAGQTDADAGHLEQDALAHPGPLHGPTARTFHEVRGQKRKRRLSRPLEQRSAWIVARTGRRRTGPDGTVVELVIADGHRVVARLRVGAHHRGSLAQIAFERALPGVAGVDEQHRARIGRAHSTQILDVAGEHRDALDPAMYVVGRDDGQDDRVAARRATRSDRFGGRTRRARLLTRLGAGQPHPRPIACRHKRRDGERAPHAPRINRRAPTHVPTPPHPPPRAAGP